MYFVTLKLNPKRATNDFNYASDAASLFQYWKPMLSVPGAEHRAVKGAVVAHEGGAGRTVGDGARFEGVGTAALVAADMLTVA